ncbi:hypothetical protein [Massilia litorea]|jgi:hypothetical protein|uniref:DUF2863 family protein n=1 Tax=Massilia litorea TaxID=2769491 RepID=A0A7L9U1E4_9BURK|nr:hypothetical protein [Massilia litorea]QOL48768.1 hypothetical protein LPB04_17655 [Massilia litorea]
MPKNKKPVPRKPAAAAEPDTDALAQALADLALEVAEGEDSDPELAAAREQELLVDIRKALRKKRDEVLYGAIELARFTDPEACRLLRAHIGEQSATLHLRREDEPELEIDAFLIPLFVRSTGGLVAEETFADDAAYEELANSFVAAELDSPRAKVALVRHAYDLAEADHIGYSALQELLREAAASLTSKKPVAAPLLEASIRGWTGERFAPDETAMELRFLFGFSLKRADDPFYAVPKDEIDADVYFADRMRRYRAWTERVAPLVRRCLAADPDSISVDFLYQDLFHGAKEQGVSELAMLGTLAEINRLLAGKELAADRVRAVVAPLDAGEHIELRVNLYALDGGPPWGGTAKPVDLAADLGAEVDELCDALGSIGIDDVSTADGFDDQGHPEGAQPYPPG